ncbi:MAG: hypothetical protein ACSHX6_09135 [Akkermansiaceae bacterium]
MKTTKQPKRYILISKYMQMFFQYPPVTVKSAETTCVGLAQNQIRKVSKRSGFALITTITIMSLLMLVSLAMLSLSNIEVSSNSIDKNQEIAEANARMALMLALGELQKSAGHDQRVTATADLTLPVSGDDSRRNWVGVWDSSLYDPSGYDIANPTNNKTFLKWLVSSQNQSSLSQQDASAVGLNNPFVIFDGTVDGTQESHDVVVDEIEIMDASGTQTGSYAYWVEDNGVKADISWNESLDTRDEIVQAARLSSSPGADPRVFQDASAPYDLDDNETLDVSLDFIQNLDKTFSFSSLALADNSSGSYQDWLKRYRHDISVGSKAVLSDTKLGGLQRDLSLAFEMDGAAEAESATKFNEQRGEFVSSGNSERLDSTGSVGGLPVSARYLHRDTQSSGGPFSGDIINSSGVLRGPTWWLLRDYANLYKNVSGTEGDYTLQARAYYPNKPQGEELSSKLNLFNGNAQFDLEVDTGSNSNGKYINKPAKANYAPVSLGGTVLLSTKAEGSEVVLAMDMLFYLWNPYNHKISCDNLVMSMDAALPGAIFLWKDDGSGSPTLYAKSLNELIKSNVSTDDVSFLIKSETNGAIVLEPGEVVIATPSTTQGQSNLGFTLSSDSGIILRNLGDSGPITAASGDKIGFRYINILGNSVGVSTAGMRNSFNLFLPNRELDLSDLSSTSNFTSELQYLHFPSHALQSNNIDTTPQEYFMPETESSTANKSDPVKWVDFGDIGSSKIFFGLLTSLTKPALWEGGNPNPVEVFSRFNPNPIVVKREGNRICQLNQVYNMLCSDNADDLLLKNGIEYSNLVRNAYWGSSYTSLGSEFVPLSTIPTSPLHSLASLSHANVSTMAMDAFHPIGNSWSSPYVPTSSVYGRVHNGGNATTISTQDLSWNVNDALFDRYYFSGIAPYYSISSSGYSLDSGASVRQTLNDFFGEDYRDAKANPALQPYVSVGENVTDVVDILDPDTSSSMGDGYSKLAAYVMLDGAFNINSTSEKAWEALLRSNKNMDILYSDGGDGNGNDTPFPNSVLPANEGVAPSGWSGFERLDDGQIQGLAAEIVRLVKERGPFMGLSDFVNRQIGTHEGVIQAAIQNTGINGTVAEDAGGIPSIYDGIGNNSMNYFLYEQGSTARNSATGLPKEINQAQILLPLASRMRPRSDTFTIRAYGSSISSSGVVNSTAYCEAVVQRVPEYIDSGLNAPWDEPRADPHDYSSQISPEDSTILQGVNKTFGRKFRVVSFRWLSKDEI